MLLSLWHITHAYTHVSARVYADVCAHTCTLTDAATTKILARLADSLLHDPSALEDTGFTNELLGNVVKRMVCHSTAACSSLQQSAAACSLYSSLQQSTAA